MQRLQEKNINTAQEYNRIFQERAKAGPSWQDVRRWKKLLKYYDDGFLIDIGCLDSQIPDLIRDKDKYCGIDLAIDVNVMKKKYPGANYENLNLYNLHLRGWASEYDYAILGEVLEHLEEPERAVKKAFSILRPGGVLAISVPLEEAKEPGAVDGDRHLWSFTKNDIKELLEPYSSKVKFKIIGSQWFPYKYAWPTLLAYAWKK